MLLDINTKAAIVMTAKLERMGKSTLPVTIRTALNSAAFDVKKNTLLDSVDDNFINRSPNFFKAFSRVEKAEGFNVNTMRSVVGMTEKGLKGANNYAVADLEQQEKGGTISSRQFIPLTKARGGNPKSLVKPKNRLSQIHNVVNAKNMSGKTKGAKFAQAAIKAGVGGYVIGSTNKGENILWRVNSLKSNVRTKSFRPTLTPLYDYSPKRKVRVKATHFMREASVKSGQLIERFYIEAAQKQFKKLL